MMEHSGNNIESANYLCPWKRYWLINVDGVCQASCRFACKKTHTLW